MNHYAEIIELMDQMRELEVDEKDECYEYGHRVLFCLGIKKNKYLQSNYYCCKCLNCGERLYILEGNMEDKMIIDGRKHIPKTAEGFVNSFIISEVIEQATLEYHLLRECYYKYPGVLKETDKKDKMIYKVMRKRYETK